MKSALLTGLLAIATTSLLATSAHATDPDTDYRLRQLEQRMYYLERRVDAIDHGSQGHRFMCTLTTQFRSYNGVGPNEYEATQIARDACMRTENNQYNCFHSGQVVCRQQQ